MISITYAQGKIKYSRKIECEKVKKIIDNITCPIWICGGSGVVEGWLGSGTERGEPFKSQKGGNAMLEEIIRKWGGHEVSAMQVYQCRRKAPCFSYGDIRRPLFII